MSPTKASRILKLRLHDAIYRLRFYSNSLIHILSLQKYRGDKSHRVIVVLRVRLQKSSPNRFFGRVFTPEKINPQALMATADTNLRAKKAIA